MILSATTRLCGKHGKHEISSARSFPPFCDHPPDLPQGKTKIGAGAPSRASPCRTSDVKQLLFVFAPSLRTNNTRGTKQLRDRRRWQRKRGGERDRGNIQEIAVPLTTEATAVLHATKTFSGWATSARAGAEASCRKKDKRGNPLPDFGARQRRIFHWFIFELNGLL